MPGWRFRGFEVADFADHDDIWVMAQKRSQSGGKRQLDLGVHLHLGNARQLIFHRIFDGENVQVWLVDFVEAGIQRGGFSKSQWARHQNDPWGRSISSSIF